MLWDLPTALILTRRIAMYTQISAGTYRRVQDIIIIPATYSDVHADVLGHTHRVPMYTEIDIIAGSQSAVRRIGVYTKSRFPTDDIFRCPRRHHRRNNSQLYTNKGNATAGANREVVPWDREGLAVDLL